MFGVYVIYEDIAGKKKWVLAMHTPYLHKAEDKAERLKSEGHKEVRVYEDQPFTATLKDDLLSRK